MSTTYAGKSVAIVSSSNATPVVIQATAHGYLSGDVVQITGHNRTIAGAPTALERIDGRWTITFVDANHFSLNGSSSAGATGGASGAATMYLPNLTIPSGGDLRNVSSVNVAFEALADRTACHDAAIAALLGVGLPVYPLLAQRLTRSLSGDAISADLTHWIPETAFGGAPAGTAWKQLVSLAAHPLVIPIDLPHQASWRSATVNVIGEAAYDTLPTLRAFRILSADGTFSYLGSIGTDPSASTLDFEAAHGITVPDINTTIDRTQYRYGVILFGVIKSPGPTNMYYLGGSATFDVGLIDNGAA